MKLQKINNEWWIIDCHPDEKRPELPGIGPYASKWDAQEDMDGLERYRTLTPRQISVDSKARKETHGKDSTRSDQPSNDQGVDGKRHTQQTLDW